MPVSCSAAEPTLVAELLGCPRHPPDRLFVDRGYDDDMYRRLLRARRIRSRHHTVRGSECRRCRSSRLAVFADDSTEEPCA